MDEADAEIEALISLWPTLQAESPSDRERLITHKIKSFEDEATSASVVLECKILEGYPETSPQVRLSNPRGLGDDEFDRLRREVDVIIGENAGLPAISAIFQKCVDFLGENQHKNVNCPVCMFSLLSMPIIVTACDHFMHSQCFCSYLRARCENVVEEVREQAKTTAMDNVDRSVPCPTCREILSFEGPGSWKDGRESVEEVEARIGKMIEEFSRNDGEDTPVIRRNTVSQEEFDMVMREWHEQQVEMNRLLESQRAKNGIIDVEEERQRNQFRIGPELPSPENDVICELPPSSESTDAVEDTRCDRE